MQQALEGLILGTIMRQKFDFLGLSVATYSDHIEVKSVWRDVMSAVDKPAADNEMAIGDGMVAMAGSLIGKLQWMTTLIRRDLSKWLNAALSLLNTRSTRRVNRVLNNVVRFYKKRSIQ